MDTSNPQALVSDPTPLAFNIAARLSGDMRENDELDKFLHSLERVKTDDYTESILVNAVKDVLHDPKPEGFAFNRISSPEGSFVRVDATIWIGMPKAPMSVSIFFFFFQCCIYIHSFVGGCIRFKSRTWNSRGIVVLSRKGNN